MPGREIDRPIFIIGCGRSGTTLLYELLCAHPHLAWFSNYTQRWPALPHLAVLSRLRSLGQLRTFRVFPRPAEGHAVFDRCRPSADNGPLTAEDATPEEIRCLREVVRAHLRFQGKPRFANKNTRNTRRIRYLDRIFPDALFIHVVRDPRATVASLLRVVFWPDLPIWWRDDRTPRLLEAEGVDPVELAAEFWRREVDQVRGDRAVLGEGRYLEVRYEDLVAAPIEQLDEVLAFADLALDPRLLSELGSRGVESSNYKYRREFTEAQLADIGRIVASTASRFGYSLDDGGGEGSRW